MEVAKAKYKESEVGLIPEDWLIIKLDESLNFKNGLNKESEFFGYGTPIINYMDVFNYQGIKKQNVKGKVFLTAQEKKNFSAKIGDVFFTRTSETQEEIGTAAVLIEEIEDCVFSGFVLRGRPKNNVVSTNYYQYCLAPKYVREQIISTSSYTTRALTNGRYLSEVHLAIPESETEQKVIANTLSNIDELIESLEKLIIKKKAIKQGAMQQLLTPPNKGGKRLDGFMDEWHSKKIGEFTTVKAGGTPSTKEPDFWGGNIPWMNSGELNLKQVYDVENRITELGLNNSSTNMMPKNSVMIGLAGQGKTRGTAAINHIPLCTNQSIAAIFPSANHNHLFLYYFMDMQYHELRKLSTGDGGRGGLNLTIIKNIDVPQPSTLDEQEAIAEILFDMDREIDSLLSKKAKYQDMKLGMMQELLTGKTRLI